METVRHLKKNIREGIEEIKDNKLKDLADIMSLIRWTAWVHRDCKSLLELKEEKPSD